MVDVLWVNVGKSTSPIPEIFVTSSFEVAQGAGIYDLQRQSPSLGRNCQPDRKPKVYGSKSRRDKMKGMYGNPM